MKTIIKLVIAGVIITSCFQAARWSLNNFQFEDAVQQRLLFDARASEEEVVNIALKIANEYQIPLRESDISVQVLGQDRIVEMKYTAVVPLVPGVFTYPWTFTPRATTRLLTGPAR